MFRAPVHWSYYGFKNYHLIDMSIVTDTNAPLILNIFNSNLYRGFRYYDIPYTLRDFVDSSPLNDYQSDRIHITSFKEKSSIIQKNKRISPELENNIALNESKKNKIMNQVPEFLTNQKHRVKFAEDSISRESPDPIIKKTGQNLYSKFLNNFEVRKKKATSSDNLSGSGGETFLEEIIEQSKCDLVLDIRTNYDDKSQLLKIYKKIMALVSVYKNFRLVLKSNFISKQNFMGNTSGIYHE